MVTGKHGCMLLQPRAVPASARLSALPAADTWPMGQRIREVEQAPDGSIWLLEDAPGGRLLRLAPPA